METSNSSSCDAVSNVPARRRLSVWFALKLLIGLALIMTVCFYDGNGRKALAQFTSFQWTYLLLLGALTVFLVWVSCLKWNLFLVALGARVSVGRLMNLYFVGRFFDSFLPSTIGSDSARTVLLGRQIGSKSVALASVLLERSTGLVSLLGLTFACGLIMNVFEETVFLTALILVSVFCFVLLVAMIYGQKILSVSANRLNLLPGVTKLASKLTRVHGEISRFRDRHWLLAAAFGYSLLYYLVTGFKMYVACLCIGVSVSPVPIIVITPILLLVMVIPISIGNLGWWEWACTVLLMGAGLDAPQGLAVALLQRAFTFTSALAGGVLLLQERSTHTQSITTAHQVQSSQLDEPSAKHAGVTTDKL